MSITREDFRKMIARHDGGFTFQAEWLNMLRGKDGMELKEEGGQQ